MPRSRVAPRNLLVSAARLLVLVAVLGAGFVAGRASRDGPSPSHSPSRSAGPRAAGRPAPRPPERAAVPAPPAVPLAARVVIVSVDGLRPDLIGLADAPRLRALAAAGSYTLWARTVPDPYVYTLPSHVSMLTGAHPDRHGVTWNDYIEDAYPAVPTLFDLAKRHGRTTALVTGKAKFVAVARPESVDWRSVPVDEWTAADADVAARAADLVRDRRPDVLFVHLGDVDAAGHADGWGSPAQLAAVGRADAAVGRVVDAVDAAGLGGSTLVIVTADHGGAVYTHGGDDPRSRTIPWIARGPGVRPGADLTRFYGLDVDTYDTFATACAALGIPVPPDCDGKFVAEILDGRSLLIDLPARPHSPDVPATAPATGTVPAPSSSPG